jgi:ABC-2 type transport system permease protein
MKKIFLIIEREFSIRVKKKSFILTTLLVPLLLAALLVVPVAIQLLKDTDRKTIVVLDHSGLAAQALHDTDELTFAFFPNATLDSLKQAFQQEQWYAIVDIGAVEGRAKVPVSMYAFKQPNLDVQQHVERTMKKAIEQQKLQAYPIQGLDSIIASVKTDLNIQTFIWGDDGRENASNSLLYMVLSYVFSFLIYMFIALFGSMVMRGVIEEKTSRIIEVIVSSVKPFQLMVGKIVGVASVGLLQFIIWVALTGILFAIAGSFMNAAPADMAAAPLPVNGMAGQTMPPDFMESFDVFALLEGINIVAILVTFLFYFLFGYFLYASLYAAIGSAVENEADTQQLIIPVTIPLVIGMLLMLHTFRYPDSSLSFWGSMIPFTSPMVMMARIPFGVPFWEVALSLFILFITFIGIAWVAGKIYRVGILMYGKKPTLKEMWKWISYKN